MSEQDIDEEVARILCQVKEKGILSSLEELQPLKNYNYETEENQLEDNYLEQNQISNYNQELEHVEEGIVYSDSGKEELEDGEIEDREIEEYNNQEDDYENENKDLEYDELHKREDSDNGNHHVEVINLSTGDPDNLDQIDNIGLEEADLQELLEIEEEAMNEEEHEALSQSQTSIPVDFYNYPPLEVRPLSRITQHSPPGKYISLSIPTLSPVFVCLITP
jgi:hypothetical protein